MPRPPRSPRPAWHVDDHDLLVMALTRAKTIAVLADHLGVYRSTVARWRAGTATMGKGHRGRLLRWLVRQSYDFQRPPLDETGKLETDAAFGRDWDRESL